MKNNTISIILPNFGGGGAERAYLEIAKELAKDYTFDDEEDVDSFMTIFNKVTRDVMGLTQEVSSGASYDNVAKDTAKLGQN